MSKVHLNYTLIHLGGDMYDLRPEPTILRFASKEQADKFMENLTNSGSSSELTTPREGDTR